MSATPVVPVVDMGVSRPDNPAPATRIYDPAEDRENARALIAFSLIGLLALIITLSIIMLWIHPDRDKVVQSWLTLIFGPLVALVGTATGFYFGARDPGSKT